MIDSQRILSGIGFVSLIVMTITGCATTSPDTIAEPVANTLPARPKFIPANYVARVKHGGGEYNRLLALPSHAVWVDKTISEMKQAYEQQNNPNLNNNLINGAEMISNNFIVIECHIETMFADSSIAYDVSGLRNLNIYLNSPNGTKVYPLQHLLLTPALEKQVGTLRQYNRTNVLVFAMEDIISGLPTLPSETNSIRLNVEGFNSSYYFEWLAQEPIVLESLDPNKKPDITDVIRWRPTQAETYQVLKVRFSDLYSQLQALTRIHRN